jgi:hypothetical protein
LGFFRKEKKFSFTFVIFFQLLYPFDDEVMQNSSKNHDHLHEINHSMTELISLHLNKQSKRKREMVEVGFNQTLFVHLYMMIHRKIHWEIDSKLVVLRMTLLRLRNLKQNLTNIICNWLKRLLCFSFLLNSL